MDKTTFHKRSDMIEAIEKAGHIALYLPPYSPDLNPIEKRGGGQCKTIRKQKKCESKDAFLMFNVRDGTFN